MLSPLFFWLEEKTEEIDKPTGYVESVGTEKSSNNVANIKKTAMTKQISTDSVKQLRDQTGISVMQCKKALEEADGDFDKALVILRKKSGELAAKKSDRTFKAGAIQAYIHANGQVGTIVELLCESDFVSGNADFQALARDIAMHATATNPKFINREDISEADRATATAVFEAEVAGKPEAVKEKILAGKLDSYFGEMVLMEQPFIKNPELNIKALIDGASQKFGEKMAIGRFKRFKVLEG